MSEELQDLLRLLRAAPWTKPDGRSNTYACLHEGLLEEWFSDWEPRLRPA